MTIRSSTLLIVLTAILAFPPIPATASANSGRTLALELYHALSRYLNANGMTWPQCPYQYNEDPRNFVKWWEDTLEPHLNGSRVFSNSDFDFVPQPLGPGAMEAFREQKPWFIVIPANSNRPILSVFPDGSMDPAN